MTAKKSDYLIIYCFVFASILCIAVLARLFVVVELKMDEFSGLVAFVITCLLLGASYFSFQSIINEWLLPVVERIFRKKHPHIEIESEVEPIQSLEIIAPQEKATVPNYEEYKQTAQQKKTAGAGTNFRKRAYLHRTRIIVIPERKRIAATL